MTDPRRTNRATFKIRRADGVVIERDCVSGRFDADNPGWSIVSPDAVSVRERVERLTPAEVSAKLLAAGITTSNDNRLNALTGAVEAGDVTL